MAEKEKIEFLEEDIEVLDFIIDLVLKSPFGILDNKEEIVKHDNFNFNRDGYIDPQNDTKREKEFVRITGIINSYNCTKCKFRDNSLIGSQNHIGKSETTEQFKKLGGFRKEYNESVERKKRADFEFEKSQIDFTLANNMLKEYPYTKWAARIGIFISASLALLEIIRQITE